VTAARLPTPGAPPVIVFYISGHAFGHASRCIEIINAILAAGAGAEVVVRTSVPRWLFDVTVRGAFEFHARVCDTGVVQRDSLNLDEQRSVAEAARFMASIEGLAQEEAAFLRRRGATLVVGDIPPLAFAAARAAGLPSVAGGNFTWDWIYAGYREAVADWPGLLPAIRRAYGHASLALRLPMWGGFDDWRSPIVDVPFVARHSAREAADVRDAIGVPAGNRLALASFGGLGLSGLPLEPLGRLKGWSVLTTSYALDAVGQPPPGVFVLEDVAVYRRGFRYEDLVRAADVVVTKPGYGIIAECLANGAAILYTDRGHFAEYDVLVAAMPSHVRCRYMPRAHLLQGCWQDHLDAVLTQPPPPERPRTDGASVAAGCLLSGLNACGGAR
jgi:L-arabinokinase